MSSKSRTSCYQNTYLEKFLQDHLKGQDSAHDSYSFISPFVFGKTHRWVHEQGEQTDKGTRVDTDKVTCESYSVYYVWGNLNI